MNYAEQIKQRIQTIELFEFYGFRPNRAGFCRSPFATNDKTPSLKIYDGDRGWHDFSSGKGGDLIDFVAAYFNLSFQDAVKKINTDFGLGFKIGKPLSDRDFWRAKKEIAERKRKQKEKEKTHARLQAEYYKALDRWIALDNMARENVPKSPSEISDKYVYAVSHIDEARFFVDIAADALLLFEKSH